MKKSAFLFYFLIIFAGSSYSQNIESYDLQLLVMGMLKDYKMEYSKSHDATFLIVGKRISTDKLSTKDSIEVNNVMKKNVWNARSKKHFAQLLDKYNTYKTDTVIVKPEDSIRHKVDDFVKNWSDLKRNVETNPDKNIGLDGYTLRLSLESKLIDYEDINVRNPDSHYYPEIFELITEIENYYKRSVKDPVLD